jgi:hypothetical protein
VWYRLEPLQLHLSHPLKTRAARTRARLRGRAAFSGSLVGGGSVGQLHPWDRTTGWRWLTRTRVHLKRKMGVIRNQVEGLLEPVGIRLTGVLSDAFGVSGWAMLERIAKGETDVEVLAAEARGEEESATQGSPGRTVGSDLPVIAAAAYGTSAAAATAGGGDQPSPGGSDARPHRHLSPVAKAFPSAATVRLLGGSLCRQSGIAGRLLQPSLGQGEPLSAAFAMPDCVGGHSHQRHVLRRFVRPLPAWKAKARRLGCGSPSAQSDMAHAARRGRISGEGIAYANPRTLARNLRRLLREFERAGIDPKSILAQPVPATA